MGKVVSITDAEFEQKVLNAEVPVVVDFWAPWCGPCLRVAPILDELAGEYEGRMVIAKVNTDEEQKYAMKFGIMAIPTLVMFKGGSEVGRIQGARFKKDYQEAFNGILAS